MKIDNRADALIIAKNLADAESDVIAVALLEAHLEGIEQARSQLAQGRSIEQIAKELRERAKFIQKQISSN